MSTAWLKRGPRGSMGFGVDMAMMINPIALVGYSECRNFFGTAGGGTYRRQKRGSRRANGTGDKGERVTPLTAQRHPWNHRFEWQDHAGPSRSLTDEQVRSFDDQGFCIVPDLVTGDALVRTVEETDRLEAWIDGWLQRQEQGRAGIAEAGAITFNAHLVARSPWLRDLVRSQPLLDIVSDLVGPDALLYWDQLVYKKPEKPRRFPWHQDNGYGFVEPQQYLTVWLALTDATVDNGCPQVVPGAHRRGTLAHRWVEPLGFQCLDDPPEVRVAEVKAGSAVVFSSLTVHQTGPNVTDAVRKAYIIQYCPSGAVTCEGDPESGPPVERTPCGNDEWQFPVLRGRQPVADPPSTSASKS